MDERADGQTHFKGGEDTCIQTDRQTRQYGRIYLVGEFWGDFSSGMQYIFFFFRAGIVATGLVVVVVVVGIVEQRSRDNNKQATGSYRS